MATTTTRGRPPSSDPAGKPIAFRPDSQLSTFLSTYAEEQTSGNVSKACRQLLTEVGTFLLAYAEAHTKGDVSEASRQLLKTTPKGHGE